MILQPHLHNTQDTVMLWYLLLLLLSLLTLSSSRVINTTFGALEGAEMNSFDGRVNYMYKAIPLAQPPIGDLRFAMPQKPLPWEGIRDARQYSAACMANASLYSDVSNIPTSEDCLYGNVFVGERCNATHKCPVIVYIHGGAYNFDSAVMFNDSHIVNKFAAKDVVFFIPAYRLGLFGFLHFEDDSVVPRNLALYDIINALEWMQSEIGAFGGDNTQVTLLGHSSGATTALLLSMSERVRSYNPPLIQRVISWAGMHRFFDSQMASLTTMQLAYHAGCVTSPKMRSESRWEALGIVECLRTKSPHELLDLVNQMDMSHGKLPSFGGIVLCAPIVEDNSTLEDLLANAPVQDTLLGSGIHEFADTEHLYDFGAFIGVKNLKEVSEKYINDTENGYLPGNASYSSQMIYVSNYMYGTALLNAGSNVYLWQMDKDARGWHAGDMYYVVGIHQFDFDEDDYVIDALYSNYFVHFAKNGRPGNDKWSQFDPVVGSYWSVDSNKATGVVPHMKYYYHYEETVYWLTHMTMFDAAVSFIKNVPHQLFPVQVEMPAPDNRTGLVEARTTRGAGVGPWIPLIIVFAVLILVLAVAAAFVLRKRCPYPTRNRSNQNHNNVSP